MTTLPKFDSLDPIIYSKWWKENFDTPFGQCICGCGQQTEKSCRGMIQSGIVKNQPKLLIKGHLKFWNRPHLVNHSGLCKCGCGNKTSVKASKKSNKYNIANHPSPYMNRSHNPQRGKFKFIDNIYSPLDISDFEKGYIVGIYEGEGSAGVQNHKRDGHTLFKSRIQMTDEDTIDRIIGYLPYLKKYKQKSQRENCKPMFIGSTQRPVEVIHMLCLMYPYLGERRKSQINQIFNKYGLVNRPSEIKSMSPEFQFGWTIGFFEAEGSFKVSKPYIKKNGHSGYQTVGVVVSSTDLDVMDTFQNINPCFNLYMNERESIGYKNCYTLQLNRKEESKDFTRKILPYLSSRRTERATDLLTSN